MRRHRLGAAAVLVLWSLPASQAAAGRAASVDGGALMTALENAELVVVGRVAQARRIDLHGHAAELEVQGALVGELAPGERVVIAWEELARSRTPRLESGQRVLIALEPLPSHSLWRQRFPTGSALVVAADGRALLRDPDPTSVKHLAAYLALDDVSRRADAGTIALAALAADAAPPIAASALALLSARATGEGRLPAGAATHVARLLRDPARPRALRAEALSAVGRGGFQELRGQVLELSAPGEELEAAALAALAALDGSLPPERIATLWSRNEPALRELAVRHAAPDALEPAVRELAAADPSPSVRAAAIERWVDARAIEGLAVAEAGFEDPDPHVRGAAAQALARLGAAVVEPMVARIGQANARQAAGPIAVLRLAGPEGTQALRRLARQHQDADVRRLIRLALGEPLPEP